MSPRTTNLQKCACVCVCVCVCERERERGREKERMRENMFVVVRSLTAESNSDPNLCNNLAPVVQKNVVLLSHHVNMKGIWKANM